ncbi:MAG: transcription antitermination factor NusB [Deferribacterales bacterium]|nr:transcription antitermination factor NusB [Deferribacterales bacterium]
MENLTDDSNSVSLRKRTRARQYAIQMMYCAEMNKCGYYDNCKQYDIQTTYCNGISETEMNATAENFWCSFPDEDKVVVSFAEKLFFDACSSISRNDELIKQFISKNWSFERIGVVEKCIMRLAVHELFEGDDNTPVYAIMDDYVTLAKSFGDDKSASFVNGVLESIRTKFSIERGNE